MASVNALISVDWLYDSLGRDDLKIIDGTWVMPGAAPPLLGQYIPGAQVFDIDAVADPESPMKHMLPPAEIFAQAMSNMGISNEDMVVIYDRHGLRTAPRVWWTSRMFGHSQVTVLDGGLPAWIEAGFDTAAAPFTPPEPTIYEAGDPLSGVISLREIKQRLGTDIQILDARPEGRFYGTAPEPREGLRSGHIPGSRSWPLSMLVTPEGRLKPVDDLKTQIDQRGIDLSKPIITSCGSGVTAAGLALALHLLGAEGVSVYDGSWTEWGASDAPVSLEAPK